MTITDYSTHFKAFRDVILSVIGKDISQTTICDLGCFEGYYSIEFAKMGAEFVLGIEGRQINVDKANAEYQADNLNIIKDDIKNFSKDKYSKYDVVLCAGLLYHLDFESAHNLLKNIYYSSPILVLETNIGENLPPEYHHLKPESHNLYGHIFDGVCYPEPIKGLTEKQIEARLSSAITNETSFWFTEESLVRLLKNIGYRTVTRVLHPKPVKVNHRHTYLVMR